ncbi:MAG TPA: protein kinase [Terriglobales bacterium]|nr:protein kinase [Terriglobales bacterium]
MPLARGLKLGPYEIDVPLGAGGMGEVYRAKDTRLDRTVAVKILPAHLSESGEARQRFDREARAISSLSHPNICHLYDVGQQDGISYLVMEYLEGETLAQRLRRGGLPLEQVFRVGAEICNGLAQAHRNGVVHRDLKPGNIMLTKSSAKLMDFGLAKANVALLAGSSSSNSLATMSQPLTSQGTIVGTIQYMSPEQLEGKEADKRSDIFSLGAVLYEMITGKRAFEGKTTASTIAAILTADPKPLTAVQPLSPPALQHLIRTCLAKDPDERWQSCADISQQVQWLSRAPQSEVPVTGRKRLPWTALSVPVLIAAAIFMGMRMSRSPVRLTQFEVNPPPKTYFNFRGLSGPPVPSPDGTKVAFVAFNQGKTGTAGLWLRSFASTDARFLSGTEGATFPFWSPDGRFLAFFADGKLKKLDLSGGSAIPICDVIEGRGGTWSTDGLIIFGVRADSLFLVQASGGKPTRLTTLDEGRHETSHRWPQFLPDQKHFLFVAQAPQIPTGRVFVGSLGSSKMTLVEDVTTSAKFSNNRLFYVVDNSLLTRGFDPGTFRFTGEPVVVAEHVQNDPQFNYAAFSVSDSTLIYQTGAVVAGTRVVCSDRSGKQTVLSEEPYLVQTLALSPKEDQLAASLGISSGQLNDIWVFDLHKDTKAKLTFDQRSFSPAWSPDGKRLAFDRIDADGDSLIAKDASGSGAEEVLYKLPAQHVTGEGNSAPQNLYPIAWTSDGKYLIYRGPGEIDALSLLGERKSTPLFQTKTGWTGVALSPDGRWLAYSSKESGLPEIYVVPLRSAADGTLSVSGGKWVVSSGGGSLPEWRGDGKELFFTNSSFNTLMSARLNITGDHFESDKPQPLFDLDAHPVSKYYAVSRDGQKIYMTTYGPGSTAPFTVTTNWKESFNK